MEINKIYNENCLDTMARMPDNFIDLTVTSPPYDDLRTYNGYCFDFENVAKELFRVTKQGGVVVWVVGDATKNGCESLTSFKQAIYFVEQCGFNLHDTMIYAKQNPIPLTHNRYEQQFEYMFILSKGKPKTFNGLKEKSKYGGEMASRTRSFYKTNTESEPTIQNKRDVISDEKLRNNIWYYIVGSTQTGKIKHPAMFPEQLASDQILSWSNENDLVYDCFIGSGTTAKMSILNNRKYIGSELSKEYYEIALNRISECGGLFFNSFQTELSNEAGT
jgi:site-specific DNA-methyltransferase (adenine-specific)